MDAFLRAANENAVRALMRAGNHTGAESRLHAMLAEDPSDARALALLAHCRDEAERGKGRGKEVLKLARDAAAIDPEDHLVRSTLAYALSRYGKGKKVHEEAAQIDESIASENPEDSTALFNLAVAWSRSIKDKGVRNISVRMLMDDAEKYASGADELLMMAELRVREWNYATAAELAQRAMQLDPTRSDIFRVLAECELAWKRPMDAYELALEALRLSPGSRHVMRLLVRARTRSNPLLRPFIPGIDWIVEMNRTGYVTLPLLMSVLAACAAVSVLYDIGQIEARQPPVIVLSAALSGLFLYALTCYLTALFSRLRIRRDLRKIALPNF